MSTKEFDVIVYGATGFTGRLVAEHLHNTYGGDGAVRWAMAGRNQTKLGAVRDEIGALSSALIEADSADAASLDALAARGRVIISTVGPYQLYGEPLIAACAKAGTDYVDLCGEPAWMAQMIERYEAQAKASGARIVFSCGFDSIPFDLGVLYLQQHARERFGAPRARVRGRVRGMKGTFSGGTLASLLATLQAGQRDPSVAKTMRNPYALVADPPPTRQPKGESVFYEDDIASWVTPFVMAAINTKNVHRSNALMDNAYGREFTYGEMQMTGDGERGKKRARGARTQGAMLMGALAFAPTRALLKQFALPKPGQGPSKHARETGSYDILFIGENAEGDVVKASVQGDMDPGYGSTSKMISEAALCLNDTPRETTPGGVWTPASAMGAPLIERLQAKAGLTFAIET